MAAAPHDAGAALVDVEIVGQIGGRTAADLFGDLQLGNALIRLEVLCPALTGQGQRIQLDVVVGAAPLILSRIVAVVGDSVNQFPVALHAPLIAVQRIFHAIKHKAVFAVGVADGTATGGDDAVSRAGCLHDAPDLVIGGGRHSVAGKHGLHIGSIALNGLDGGDDAPTGDGLALAAGADGDDIADLQRTLGNDNGGL